MPETTSRWELAAETIVVKIRWFGVILGGIYVHFGSSSENRLLLDLLLTLGAIYTLFDTWYSLQSRVMLDLYPLSISVLEAVFIGLLCYLDSGFDSPFRYYYLLSLICCAFRYSSFVTWITCGLDCVSFLIVWLTSSGEAIRVFPLFLLVVILIWVTWAAGSLARLLQRTGEDLRRLNAALRENQLQLESRIRERTQELQETQAQLMHQDKMAGFGLLAAGIAHEVGNPLTSVSSLIQMLERRDPDSYTREKLGLVSGQLTRIQGILRELMSFSRPVSPERTRFRIGEMIQEAMGIAKYYHGTRNRIIRVEVEENLPVLHGVRDQLVQVIFNLILNAIDATGKGGRIDIRAGRCPEGIEIGVIDDGTGIEPQHRARIFEPYFTTKKQGTGLGLFVIRKLILEHGGSVDFESEQNHGTTFRIRLPLPVEQAPVEKEVPEMDHP